MSHDLPTTALSRGPAGTLPELGARYLEEYLDKIRLSVERLDETALWWRPAPATNSAGNLLLHLVGNLSLWILDGLGGRPYDRDRAREFAAQGGPDAPTAAALIERLTAVVADCREVLEGLDGPDGGAGAGLAAEIDIQGYRVDRLGALFHAVEHMAYHTGQIVWIVKQLRPQRPLEFYPRHAGE